CCGRSQAARTRLIARTGKIKRGINPPKHSLTRMTIGDPRRRHPKTNKVPRAGSLARPLTYERMRKLEGLNRAKVRPRAHLTPIPRRLRCQFDTGAPWWRAAEPDRQDTMPVRRTSPDVCGIFSGPAHR